MAKTKIGGDLSGIIRSLRDLEIIYVVFADLFFSYPTAILGFVIDAEKAIQESDKHSMFDFQVDGKNCLERVERLAENIEDRQRVFRNLHVVIQQYALNMVYQYGTVIIGQSSHKKEVFNEPWYRIMSALRNASVHGGVIENRGSKIFKKSEERVEWNGICLAKSDLGGVVMERMVQDNAVWKLIYKMEEAVKHIRSNNTDDN